MENTERNLRKKREGRVISKSGDKSPVSYTHLTLPTIYSV